MHSRLNAFALLLYLLVPTGARAAEVLTIQTQYSSLQVQSGSGVWLDLLAPVGSVFLPFVAQTGGGVGGSTDGLRTSLTGRILAVDLLDQLQPFFQIGSANTLIEAIESGSWRPGVPGAPATPAAAALGVAFGSLGSLALGEVALRDVSFTIDASHSADPLGNQRWAWPTPPFIGPTGPAIGVSPSGGFADLDVGLVSDLRTPLSETVKVPLVLSEEKRGTIERSSGGGLRLILPVQIDTDIPGTALHTALPVHVHLALSGQIVAQNPSFIPEPDAALAGAAAALALALVAARRRRSRTSDSRLAWKRRFAASLGLWLVHAACGSSSEVTLTNGDGDPTNVDPGVAVIQTVSTTLQAGGAPPLVYDCNEVVGVCAEPLHKEVTDGSSTTSIEVDPLAPPRNGASIQVHAEGLDAALSSVDLDVSFESLVSVFGSGDEALILVIDTAPLGDTSLFDDVVTLSVRNGVSDPDPQQIVLDGSQTVIPLAPGVPNELFFDWSIAIDAVAASGAYDATWTFSYEIFDSDERCQDDLDCPAETPVCVIGGQAHCDTGQIDGDCANPADCAEGLVCSGASGTCADPATNVNCLDAYECDYGCFAGFCRHGQLGEGCEDPPGCAPPLACTAGLCAAP